MSDREGHEAVRPVGGNRVTGAPASHAPARRGPWRWLAIGLATASVSTVLRVRWAERRYRGRAPEPGRIDLTVVPPDPTLADGTPVELLALGDSGMAGTGVERPTDTLPAQIATRVASRTGRPVHVVSRARPGARTREVLLEQLAGQPGAPDVVVLLVGTNDVIHLTRGSRLAGDTLDLFARLHRLGAPVVMSCLPEFRAMRAVPRGLRFVLRVRAFLVRRMHRRAVLEVSEDFVLVDVRATLGDEFLREPELMSPDHFHPSAAGYSRIAEALTPAVTAAVLSLSGIGVEPGLPPGRPRRPATPYHAA